MLSKLLRGYTMYIEAAGSSETLVKLYQKIRRHITENSNLQHVFCFLYFFFSMVQQPLVGQGLLIIEASRSHSDTSHSVGLLCTRNQPVADTST